MVHEIVVYLAVIAAMLQLTSAIVYYFGVVKKIQFNGGPTILSIAMIMLFVQQFFGIWLYTHYGDIETEFLKYTHMFALPVITSILFLWMAIKKIKYINSREINIQKIAEKINGKDT